MLLEEEGIENDIKSTKDGLDCYINSIFLNKYLSNNKPFNKHFDSFDAISSIKYEEMENRKNIQFSYILGNYVRYYMNDKFVSNELTRLYVLTSVLENFSYRENSVRLTIGYGLGNSFVEFQNQDLLSRLKQSHKKFII